MVSYFRGKPACSCLIAWLPAYEAELKRRHVIKHSLDVYQLIGGAPQSGGTHSTGQCADTAQRSDTAIWVARQMGADASWDRPYNWDNRKGMAHAHLNLRGCPHGTPAADRQYTSKHSGVDHGKNGLANGGKDDGPRPLSKRTYKQGIAWAKAQQPKTFKPTTYYVTVPKLTAHKSPDVNAATLPSPVRFAGKLVIRGTREVHGTTWGWTARPTGKAWWILEGRTSTKQPVVPVVPKPVAEIVVGTHNAAAQATGHSQTWRSTRAPLCVAQYVESYADVVLGQEFGSGIYLDALDTALDEADTDLTRVNGGRNWRHILRLSHRSKFIAAKTVTLKDADGKNIGTDGDGSQVAMCVLEFSGVRASFGTFHFDVAATDETHRKQAEEAWAQLAAFSKEHGVDPLNWTIGGDTNDKNGVVDRVMRSHGLVPMAVDAPKHHQADKKTTNRWTDEWVKGPRIDNIYVPEGASIEWRQVLKSEASNHQYQVGVRKLYTR